MYYKLAQNKDYSRADIITNLHKFLLVSCFYPRHRDILRAFWDCIRKRICFREYSMRDLKRDITPNLLQYVLFHWQVITQTKQCHLVSDFKQSSSYNCVNLIVQSVFNDVKQSSQVESIDFHSAQYNATAGQGCMETLCSKNVKLAVTAVIESVSLV